jgi:hypothetical protein
MPKKQMKKSSDCCSCCGHEELKKDLHKLGDDVVSMVKDAKGKYDKMDDKSKKKIIAGVAGAAALLAGAIGIGKIKKKK